MHEGYLYALMDFGIYEVDFTPHGARWVEAYWDVGLLALGLLPLIPIHPTPPLGCLMM